jgi:hypothetical protein
LQDFCRQASEKFLPIRRLLIALEFLHVVFSFYRIRPQLFLITLISVSPALTFDRSGNFRRGCLSSHGFAQGFAIHNFSFCVTFPCDHTNGP